MLRMRFGSLVMLLPLACAHGKSTDEKKPAPVEVPAPLDRAKMPSGTADKDLEVPPAQVFTLSNGLTVALVERHALPVFGIHLMVRGAGYASDPKDQAGMASLTAGLLDEGAGNLNAAGLAEALEKLGASVGAGAGSDAAYVSASGLTRVLDGVLSLFADVVIRPTFAAADVTRVKGEVSTDILRERDSGPTMARLLFSQTLFAGHPYGSRPNGTPQSLPRLDGAGVKKFHADHYVPQASVLVVVGDVTRADMEPRLQRALDAWTSPLAAPALPPVPAQHEGLTVTLFDRPGAAQSSITAGLVGIERTHEDHIPATVMNAIFGGLFNSRLNLNLREDKHWSYGARSGFDARVVPGPFVAGTEVQTDHTVEALAETLKEMERMRSTLVTPEELEAAQSFMVRSLPGRFETVSGTAGSVADVMFYKLPADYWTTYGAKVKAVTAQQVQQVAQKYLLKDQLVISVAGDKAKILEGLRATFPTAKVVQVDEQGREL